jgi:hypothetical protein
VVQDINRRGESVVIGVNTIVSAEFDTNVNISRFNPEETLMSDIQCTVPVTFMAKFTHPLQMKKHHPLLTPGR